MKYLFLTLLLTSCASNTHYSGAIKPDVVYKCNNILVLPEDLSKAIGLGYTCIPCVKTNCK